MASDSFNYNIALAILYGILFLFEIIQFFRIVYYRHKFRSFQVAFLFLCWFWALLRIIFFSAFINIDWTEDSAWLYLIVYWLPINVEFATFSLLVVYYAHLQHKQKTEWWNFKRKYIITYSLVNGAFFVVEGVLVVLGIFYDKKTNEPSWLKAAHRLFSAVVFLLLMAVIGFYTWRIRKFMFETKNQPKLLAKLSPRKIILVSVSLFVIFTARAIYDFVTVIDENIILNVSKDHEKEEAVPVLVIVAFEILPTILVLILFGQVKSTTLGVLHKKPVFLHDGRNALYNKNDSLRGSTGQLLRSDIFNNPRRYDSDEETPFKSSPSPNSSMGSYGTLNAIAPYYATPVGNSLNGDLAT
eukprot:TRINITY_DN3994_c0_g1_i1.p1 TRINITY_DN3994_c0_g1~~TRINITY_DN3994_c0_g1_i1.p1  ORF type:complete len:356 (-),score=63.33 TRINITY_DN3994_c0_g1_i1:291-1358(-)